MVLDWVGVGGVDNSIKSEPFFFSPFCLSCSLYLFLAMPLSALTAQTRTLLILCLCLSLPAFLVCYLSSSLCHSLYRRTFLFPCPFLFFLSFISFSHCLSLYSLHKLEPLSDTKLLASVMIRLDRWSLLFAPTPDEDGSINASCPPDVPLTRDIPLSVRLCAMAVWSVIVAQHRIVV